MRSHRCIQRHAGDADGVERIEYHGAGAIWGDDGQRGRDDGRSSHQSCGLLVDPDPHAILTRPSCALTVAFNGTLATPTAWSASSITVPVPSGATTGNVVVTERGQGSKGTSLTVTV